MQEMVEARTALINDPSGLARSLFLMVDQTEALLVALSFTDVHELAKLDHTLAQRTPKGMVLAVVAKQKGDYELARTWEALVTDSGWETLVARSRTEAERWIRDRVAQKFHRTISQFPEATHSCELGDADYIFPAISTRKRRIRAVRLTGATLKHRPRAHSREPDRVVRVQPRNPMHSAFWAQYRYFVRFRLQRRLR